MSVSFVPRERLVFLISSRRFFRNKPNRESLRSLDPIGIDYPLITLVSTTIELYKRTPHRMYVTFISIKNVKMVHGPVSTWLRFVSSSFCGYAGARAIFILFTIGVAIT